VAPGRDAIVFWPSTSPTSVEVTDVATAIAARGSANLKLSGITIEGTRGVALDLEGDRIEVLDSTVKNIGTVGIAAKGHDIAIRRTTVSGTGASGVLIAGGNRKTLEPGHDSFESGRIENFGRLIWSSLPGIRIDGVGNSLLDSKISGGPHSGVFYFGNDHEIARNEVSDVARRTGDVGAIYTGRDWAGRGHKVHHNYIHDVQGVGTQGASALYLDDQVSGVELSDNVIWNVNRGLLLGGGRDNIVRRNLFLKTKICIRFDARGLSWQKDKTAPGGEIWKKYGEVPATSELYRSRYPGVGEVLQNQPGTPVGNQITENIGIDCDWTVDPAARTASTIENNITSGTVPLRNPAILNSKQAPTIDALQIDWPSALAAAKKK
jgi:Right handed beta helix region